MDQGRLDADESVPAFFRILRWTFAIVAICLITAACNKSSDQAAAPASDASAASAPAAAASDASAAASDAAAAASDAGAAATAPPPPSKGAQQADAKVPTCDVQAGNSPDSFPNPVPRPSAWTPPLDINFATPASGKSLTFGDVERALNNMLTKAGYSSDQYYPFPCGFALVTRIEQTDSGWTPLKPPARWAMQTVVLKKWSLQSILRQFASAQPGFYQIIVFVVTETPVTYSGTHPQLTFFDETLKGGSNKLSTNLEKKATGENVKCTVLIYEFLKQSGVQAEALSPGQLDAMSHLQKASLDVLE